MYMHVCVCVFKGLFAHSKAGEGKHAVKVGDWWLRLNTVTGTVIFRRGKTCCIGREQKAKTYTVTGTVIFRRGKHMLYR